MATKQITLEFSSASGVRAWTATINGVQISPLGNKVTFPVKTGIDYKLDMTFTGIPGGTVDVALTHAGGTIEERKPEIIPKGSTMTFDEFEFTL